MRLCEAKVKSGEVRRYQQRVTTKMAVGGAESREREMIKAYNPHLEVVCGVTFGHRIGYILCRNEHMDSYKAQHARYNDILLIHEM